MNNATIHCDTHYFGIISVPIYYLDTYLLYAAAFCSEPYFVW